MANNLKGLDAFQVLRSVYDINMNCLRVCVVSGSTGGGGGFEVIISHTDDSIRLGNGSDFFTTTYVGSSIGLDVAIIDSVLPDGAATETKQDTQIVELQNITSAINSLGNQSNTYDGVGNPITSTATNTSKQGLDIIRLNSLIPREYDDIEITQKNVDGDPEIIVFRSATTIVATLNLTYDSDGDIERVQRV